MDAVDEHARPLGPLAVELCERPRRRLRVGIWRSCFGAAAAVARGSAAGLRGGGGRERAERCIAEFTLALNVGQREAGVSQLSDIEREGKRARSERTRRREQRREVTDEETERERANGRVHAP